MHRYPGGLSARSRTGHCPGSTARPLREASPRKQSDRAPTGYDSLDCDERVSKTRIAGSDELLVIQGKLDSEIASQLM